jgi:predicted NACHT family NTPase
MLVFEWLAAVGVSNAIGFVYEKVLKDLFVEGMKDYVKDFFKDKIKDIERLAQSKPVQIAVGKALKEFLAVFQQELQELGVSDLKIYARSFKQFLKEKKVKSILVAAFSERRVSLDSKTLENTWHELELQPLPEEFDWEIIARKFARAAKEIFLDSEDLRKNWVAELVEQIQTDTRNISTHTEQIASTLEIVKQELIFERKLSPDFNLRRYCESIEERYSLLKLSILDITHDEYKLRLWNVFVFQSIREGLPPSRYEISKDDQQEFLTNGQSKVEIPDVELKKYQEEYFQKPLRSVQEIIDDEDLPYLVILGDPGSGKSTLLQYITLEWVSSLQKKAAQIAKTGFISNEQIPLLVELREYIRDRNKPESFLEFFHKGASVVCHLNERDLDTLLHDGNAVVMFDGLDEVIDIHDRSTVVQEIINFTNRYPKVRVIVTSRIVGYSPQSFTGKKFCHFTLQDFDEEQIEEFIEKWHNIAFLPNDPDKWRIKTRLQKAIHESKAIHSLAGNPLLLTMISILNRKQELPRARTELYEQASRVLLHQWDLESKQLKPLQLPTDSIGIPEKQAMLRTVAFTMQASDKGLAGNIISETKLKQSLTEYLHSQRFEKPRENAGYIVEQLHQRNFILCSLGGSHYAFVHKTFLEYFCAWAFVWEFKETQTLKIDDLKEQVFGNHWREDSWREVLRLIAGLLEPKFTSQIINYLIDLAEANQDDQSLFVASDCLIEVRNQSLVTEVADRLFEALINSVERRTRNNRDGKEQREQTTEDSQESPANRLRRLLKEHRKKIADEFSDVALKQGETTEQSPSGRKTVADLRPKVFETVALASENLNALYWLKSHAESNPKSFLRAAAVRAVVTGWKQADDSLEWLKQRAQSEQDSDVRRAVVEEIARGWRSLPDTLEWLKNLATANENQDILSIAAEAVAKSWQSDREVVPWLKNLAHSEESEVRQAAMFGLIRCGRDLTEQQQYEKALTLYEETKQFLRDTDEKSRKVLAKAFRDCTDKFNPLMKFLDSTKIRLMTFSALHQAAELMPLNVTANSMDAMRYILACQNVDRYGEAIEIAEQLNKSNSMYTHILADLYRTLGMYTEALETCQVALSNSKHLQIYRSLKDVYHELGNYDLAITTLQPALESSNKLEKHYAYRDLCWLYSDLGRFEESITAGKQAIELFPKNQPLYNIWRVDYNNLGVTYIDIGDYESAYYYLNLAMDHNSEHSVAHYWLCWIDVIHNNLTKAEKEIKQLIVNRWKPSREYFILGLIYALQGRVQDAQLNWQKALKNSSNFSLRQKIVYAFYRVLVGDMGGIVQMQDILTQYQPPAALLQHNIISHTEVMSRCPEQPEGVELLVQLIKR